MNDVQFAVVHDVLWAKTHRRDQATHPLICHLIDVAAVADVLWRRMLPDRYRESIAASMGVDSNEAGRAWAFWAGCHDLGKASPGFQRKYQPAMDRLAALGMDFPRTFVQEKCFHAWISATTLPAPLREISGASVKVARDIAAAVGGHHGLWPSALQLQNVRLDHQGGEIWDLVRRDLVRVLFDLHAPPPVHALGPTVTSRNSLLTQFSGLVSIADWIGSDETDFPFAEGPIEPLAYAERARIQALGALARHGWTEGLNHGDPSSFTEIFGFHPNPMQTVVEKMAPALDSPSLVIIEAPTGIGKTEAALLLADTWKRTLSQRGMYIAMPTMATSNEMWKRVTQYIRARYPESPLTPLLVHSMAEWLAPSDVPRLNLVDEAHPSETGAVDASWFLPRKRSLLAPVGVGTVDQVLLSVLQARHFFVRLLGLSHKTVIFDEVHAYDTYMSALFERLLHWLRSVDASVVVLSATLPSGTRRRLLAAYGGSAVDSGPNVQYPAITVASDRGIETYPVVGTPHRTIAIEQIDASASDIVSTLRKRLASGGTAAVICNTVARAQTLYRAIRDAGIVAPEDLLLFHARFPFARREAIEKVVLSHYGKLAPTRSTGHRSIVIATQVIEQSLDLDFDFMISDLCPIDLLIQRAGRLWRHKRARPESMEQPTLSIARHCGDDGLPSLGADTRVYDEAILLRTWLALQGRTQIETPTETSRLVDYVYESSLTDSLARSALEERLRAAETKRTRAQEKDANQAQVRLVLAPDSNQFLRQGSLGLEEEDPSLHAALQALTRLGAPSVSLVCLHAIANETNTEPDGSGASIDLRRAPTTSDTTALVRSVVHVQRWEVVDYVLEHLTTPPAWKEHALLRTYHPIVFHDGICHLQGASFVLQLDRETGLEVIKPDTGKDRE